MAVFGFIATNWGVRLFSQTTRKAQPVTTLTPSMISIAAAQIVIAFAILTFVELS